MKRTFAHQPDLDLKDRQDYDEFGAPIAACSQEGANLVCSRSDAFVSANHLPCIDIDFPCRLVPSRTPGHFHLYIDKPMRWGQYEQMLRGMVNAGVVQRGFFRASQLRQATFLRLTPDFENPDVPEGLPDLDEYF